MDRKYWLFYRFPAGFRLWRGWFEPEGNDVGRLDGEVAVITGAASGIDLRAVTGGRNRAEQKECYVALRSAFDQG